MTPVEQIQNEIMKLSFDDFHSLRRWFSELEWEKWDKQIEDDDASGGLDFLFEEAGAAKAQGIL